MASAVTTSSLGSEAGPYCLGAGGGGRRRRRIGWAVRGRHSRQQRAGGGERHAIWMRGRFRVGRRGEQRRRGSKWCTLTDVREAGPCADPAAPLAWAGEHRGGWPPPLLLPPRPAARAPASPVGAPPLGGPNGMARAAPPPFPSSPRLGHWRGRRRSCRRGTAALPAMRGVGQPQHLYAAVQPPSSGAGVVWGWGRQAARPACQGAVGDARPPWAGPPRARSW